MKKQIKNKGMVRVQRSIAVHPPAINGLEVRHSTTLRFRQTAAATLNVTFQNLMDTMLVATTAIAASNLFQAVRVRAVRVWGIGAVGTSTSASLEFSGTTTGAVGDQAVHTDTSIGVQPLFLSASPNARALCSNFQLSSSAIAFTINSPAGSVIDVDLAFRSQFANINASSQNAIAGGTAGAQYVRGLDGLATATTNYPVEYTIGAI